MAIKDKRGGVYKSGVKQIPDPTPPVQPPSPPPPLKTEPTKPNPDSWDNIKLINMELDDEVVKDGRIVVIPQQEDHPLPEQIKEPEPIRQELVKVEPQVVKEQQKKNPNLITIHCLPTNNTKIVIEGIMITEQDLFCVFWTNSEIPQDTVVFPVNHSRRWWQIRSVSQRQQGFIIECVITDKNWDFTD